MSPQEWQRARPVLRVAAGLTGSEGARLVEAEFPDEPTLRREVLSLLEIHGRLTRAITPNQLADVSASITGAVPVTIGPPTSALVLEVGADYGPYRVRRRLGAGGMGQVFLAEDLRLGRLVALKSLAGRWLTQPTARRQLLREARAIAALSHPNIATLYDVLDHERYLMLVMEYVEGRTAAELAASGPLPLGQALRLALQVTDAVVYAHDRGVVHCDLKPLNVQVSPEGTAKVLDFGLARAAYDSYESSPDDETRPLTLVGTPSYMPPERWLSGTLSASGDIYSLGVMIFELVTGRRPFEETDVPALMGAILGTEAPPPSSLASDCPAGLDAIVARALQRDTRQRYQTARELSRELRRVLGEVETGSQPVPMMAGRADQRPWWQSRSVRVAGVVVSSVALLCFAGFAASESYNRALGRTVGFGQESPLWWPYWGFRSMIAPGVVVIAATVATLLLGAAGRVVQATVPPVRRLFASIAGWTQRRIAPRLPPSTLSQGVLFAQVVVLCASLWWFRDLIGELTSFMAQSPGDLAALGPANVAEHREYRLIFALQLLIFGVAWQRVLRRTHSARGVPTYAVAGLSTAVLAALMLSAPYRILWQNDSERVAYGSETCYLVEQQGNVLRLFCPRGRPSRTRVVTSDDPLLQRGNQPAENIFSALD